MPKVPFSDNVVPLPSAPGLQPGSTQLAMAAAMMHQEGRLIQLDPVGPFGDSQFNDTPTVGQQLRDIDAYKASKQHLKTLEQDMESKQRTNTDDDATVTMNNRKPTGI